METIDFSELRHYLTKLDSNHSYWMTMVLGKSQGSQHYVYDCQPGSLQALVSLSLNGFFIIDKKYNWFTYFDRNKTHNEIDIFKSGNVITPFDSKT